MNYLGTILFHQQQNKWYTQMYLLAHLEDTLYFTVANLLAHNNITISYYMQVNSLQLKSSVARDGQDFDFKIKIMI